MTVSLLPSQHGTEPAPARPTKPARLTPAEARHADAVARMAEVSSRLVRKPYGCRLIDRIEDITRGRA